jgi:arylsulfatase A-like enzyme
MNFIRQSAFLFAVLLAAGFTASLAAQSRPPNVIFILADDLGAHDLGFTGSKYHQTPHLDALARRAVHFTQAYAANPLCSPTRASILTGLWPARIGITNPSCHVPEEIFEQTLQTRGPPDRKCLVANSVTRLKHEYVTLAEVLKNAGYRTGHFGKWHLGREPYDPLHQGFDVDFPHWYGPGPAGSYVAPWNFPTELGVQGQPGEHIEDRVAGEVIKFIRENKDRPFYVNYFCFSVHGPFDAKDELVAKYRALADPKSPQRNPVYAAMVESLDAAVGRVIAAVDELGLAERTIIIFFSDNGGISWDAGEGRSARFAADFTMPPTSNLPLRGGKANIYEGGVREPCLVVAPGVSKAGTKSEALVQSIDFFPTILELTGIKPQQSLRLDGVSFAPVLRGEKGKRNTVFCHFPHQTPASGQRPAASVRRGDWKLIRNFADNPDQTDRLELFNLARDPGETRDVAAQEPQLVKDLSAELATWLAETGAVIPKPNPSYDPAAKSAPEGKQKRKAKAKN